MSGKGSSGRRTRQANAGLDGHPSSMTLQEHQGFHLFSEVVLPFFDFLVTGGTYMTTKLAPKCSKKKLKNKTESKFVLYPHLLLF